MVDIVKAMCSYLLVYVRTASCVGIQVYNLVNVSSVQVSCPREKFHSLLLVHGQVTIIFVVSVCLFVCLFVQFFSAVSDPILIKLGHMLYVWV